MKKNVKISEGVIHTQIDDDLVLLHAAQGKYYALNPVGAAVWTQLSTETPVEVLQICAAIERQFEVSSERCRQDVLKLLKDLRENGLVELIE